MNEYKENAKIDLIAIVKGFFKSMLRMVLPGVLAVLLCGAVSGLKTKLNYTPMYKASASFTVHMKNPFYATQQYYNSSMAQQMAKTFPNVLTSGLLGDKVKDRLGISYLPSVSASAVGDTNIFTLTVTAADPQIAYDVLNCVIDIYPEVSEFVVGSTEFSILDESGIPTRPYNRPNYVKSIAGGAAVGFALWAFMAFAYWATHRTVNDETELSSVVNLPCVGILPRVRGLTGRLCPILDGTNDKFGFNESVRLLRIRTERALAKIGGKILLVTSTLPNEGKTTVSVNIATALAQKGKKVMLVDCDLRNPTIGKVFGIETEYGFGDFLKGVCDLDKAYFKTDIPNLYVVVGGSAVDNPSALLTGENAQTFIKATKNSFDYIVLDTPPAAMMSDAAEIGRMADANLLTVRQDFAVRSQIIEAVQNLSDNKKPIIGTVMNMTTPSTSKGSYYGYGYYGYGNDED